MKPVDNQGLPFVRSDLVANEKQKSEKKKKLPTSSFFSLLGKSEENGDIDNSAALLQKEADREAEIGKQLDEIHSLGQQLTKRQSMETIKAYKAAVKKLLMDYLNNGMELEEQISSRNILQQKKYLILRVIDEKLEKLVVGVLQTQVKQIDLLTKLEELQGLLVDLLH